MKRFKVIISVMMAAFALCCLFAACHDDDGTVEPVVITASDESFVYEDKTLLDYMNYLQGKNELAFTVNDGMVTSINGISNTSNSYWMLYTSDTDNANSDWGTYNDGGAIYGSATLGAAALVIKENCIYAWVYQTF